MGKWFTKELNADDRPVYKFTPRTQFIGSLLITIAFVGLIYGASYKFNQWDEAATKESNKTVMVNGKVQDVKQIETAGSAANTSDPFSFYMVVDGKQYEITDTMSSMIQTGATVHAEVFVKSKRVKTLTSTK